MTSFLQVFLSPSRQQSVLEDVNACTPGKERKDLITSPGFI